MVSVTLDEHDALIAAITMARRRVSAIERRRPPTNGTPKNLWGNDMEAALAELAVSKHFCLYPGYFAEDLSTIAGDAGLLQVRYTPRPRGRLIVHPQDADDRAFVLVTGGYPVYGIHGWILGVDAKEKGWWENGDGRPAFFVPQDALKRTALPTALVRPSR